VTEAARYQKPDQKCPVRESVDFCQIQASLMMVLPLSQLEFRGTLQKRLAEEIARP
jgi:hypothetical protein